MALVDLEASLTFHARDGDQKIGKTTFGIDMPADPADYQDIVTFATSLSAKINPLTSTQWAGSVIQLVVREDPAPTRPAAHQVDVEKRGRFIFNSADVGEQMVTLVPGLKDEVLEADRETIDPTNGDVNAFTAIIIAGDGTTAASDGRDYDLVTASTIANRAAAAYKEHVESFKRSRRRRG